MNLSSEYYNSNEVDVFILDLLTTVDQCGSDSPFTMHTVNLGKETVGNWLSWDFVLPVNAPLPQVDIWYQPAVKLSHVVFGFSF